MVEDETVIAMHETAVLTDNGLSVLAVPGATEAFAALERQHVDLVLMDVDLGSDEMDGIEASAVIADRYGVPVVFLSSRVDRETIQRAESISPYGYIAKGTAEPVMIGAIKTAFRLAEAREQQVVQEAESRFQSQLLQAVDQSVIATDLNGRVTYWNRGAEKLYEWPREEALGRQINETTVPSVSRAQAEQIMAALAKGETWAGDFLVTTKSGKQFYAHVTNSPIQDENGRLVGVIGLSFDLSKRMKMEEQLRKSEELKRITLQSIADGVVTTDTAGKVTDMNRVAQQLTGYSAGEALRRPLTDIFRIVHEVTGEALEDPVTKALASRQAVTLSNHTKLLSKDGRELHIADSAAPINDESGNTRGAVLVFRDETIRYRQERALAESEATFHRLFDSMAQGVVYHDRTGKIVQANGAATRILGLSLRQLKGTDSFDPRWRAVDERGEPLPPEDHPAMKALRTGERVERMLMGVYRPDRETYVWLSVSAVPEFHEGESTPYRVFATFEDVTPQHRLAEEREKNRRFLQTVFDAIQDFISVVDPELRIQRVNTRVRDMYPQQLPLVGKKCHEVYHGSSEMCEACPAKRALETKSVEQRTISLAESGGQARWFHVSAYPVVAEDGTVESVVEYARDVTDSMRERQETRQLLKERTSLLREIHHRVKNNMGVIASLLSLKSETIGDPEGRQALLEAQNRVATLQSLYDHLYRSNDYSGLSLHSYIGDVIREISQTYESESIDIEADIAEIALSANDAVQIGIVVNELVTNAVKHAFPDERRGTIKVTVESPEDDQIELRVADDGVGLPEGVANGQSEGYGLAIVTGFVEQIGGSLDMSAGDTGGTVLSIRFSPSDAG